MLVIGQKVKVKKDLQEGERYGGQLFHYGMLKHCGKTTTVGGTSHLGTDLYYIDIDLEGYCWTQNMLDVQ